MLWLSTALAAELSGTLIGADGEPIVGAAVVAYDRRFAYAEDTTTNDGRWSIVGLPVGPYRLRFMPSNGDPHGERFWGDTWDVCTAELLDLPQSDSALTGLDAALALGAQATGRITDLAGTPIEGAAVTVYGVEPRTSLVLRSGESDADGRFTVVGLDAEEAGSAFGVVVQADGWPDQYAGPAYFEDDSERVSLAAGASADLGDLGLLDGIRVSGVVSGPSGPVSSGTTYVYASSQVLAEPIGADGRYEADGLPPGDVIAWASSPGLATTYYPDADRPGGSMPVPEEGADATLDLELPPENVLQIQLSGAGQLEEVSVLVYNDTYTVGRGQPADASGFVSLGGLHPGDYFVYVYGDDGGFVDGFVLDDAGARQAFSVSGTTRVDLPLELGATVMGNLESDDGEPVYGATIRVTEQGGEGRVWSDVTDRDGRYQLSGIDAITAIVSAEYHHYCPNDAGFAPLWYEQARSEATAGLLFLTAGETVGNVDFVLPRDDDHDGMGDAWEREHGLDPNRDDGSEDPDGDSLDNAEEWVLGTDPNAAEVATGCGEEGGCAGAVGLLGLGVVLGLRRRR